MDISKLVQRDDFAWEMAPHGAMRVPAVFFGHRDIIEGLDDVVPRQLANVAGLPGIVGRAVALPDAHMGYGFPIGAVAAFDPDQGGVVSAGGVGYDIACGVRTLVTGLNWEEFRAVGRQVADRLFSAIPAGVGKTGDLVLKGRELDAMLEGGAAWAVKRGFGEKADLERMEDNGRAPGANPDMVSDLAKKRQQSQMGTLGSGNHYLEIQRVEEILDQKAAQVLGLARDTVAVSIHCGSRGLGHQIATDYLALMAQAAPAHAIRLADPQLACAPIRSDLGSRYLAAMRAGINCALANRQVLTHLTRQVWAEFFPGSWPRLLYDVSHNTCQEELHLAGGRERALFVHRKGATRAWGPNHPRLPAWLKGVGQPMPVGGSMGSHSYMLAGADGSLGRSFASSCHGAGRSLSRNQSLKRFRSRDVADALEAQGVIIRAHDLKGVAEEAPGAYKDIEAVVRSAVGAGLARPVARLWPMACIKG